MTDETLSSEQAKVLELYHQHRAKCISDVETQIQQLNTTISDSDVARRSALLQVFAGRVSDVTMLIASTHLGYKTEYAARMLAAGTQQVTTQLDRLETSSRRLMYATWALVAATAILALATAGLVLYTSELAAMPPTIVNVPPK